MYYTYATLILDPLILEYKQVDLLVLAESKNPGFLVCGRCKEVGDYIIKRPSKYKIQIPNYSKKSGKEKGPVITDIAQAWDYAARVCFRLHQDVLRFPPSIKSDEELSRYIYKEFKSWNLHTGEELKEFEARQFARLLRLSGKAKKTPHRLNAKKITPTIDPSIMMTEKEEETIYDAMSPSPKESKHVPLPDDTGRVTKFSIAWLYYSMICAALSEVIGNVSFPDETNREYAYAIYTHYSLLETDLKDKLSWYDWFKIGQDIQDGSGYHAAASKTSAMSIACKNCYKPKEKSSENGVIRN